MKFDDELILLAWEVPALKVRPEIVYPSESTTLPTPKQTYRNIQQTITYKVDELVHIEDDDDDDDDNDQQL